MHSTGLSITLRLNKFCVQVSTNSRLYLAALPDFIPPNKEGAEERKQRGDILQCRINILQPRGRCSPGHRLLLHLLFKWESQAKYMPTDWPEGFKFVRMREPADLVITHPLPYLPHPMAMYRRIPLADAGEFARDLFFLLPKATYFATGLTTASFNIFLLPLHLANDGPTLTFITDKWTQD